VLFFYPENNVEVSEVSAEVELQDIVDHKRGIFQDLKPFQSLHFEPKNPVLFSKLGDLGNIAKENLSSKKPMTDSVNNIEDSSERLTSSLRKSQF
jgi:hypothetical protein